MTLSPRGFLALRAAQALAIAGVIAYAVQGAVPACQRAVGDAFELWVYPGLILAAGGFCLVRALRARADRVAWTALGTAIVLWAAAELYGSLDDFATSGSFGVPDALWLAFYPAALLGLGVLVRTRVRRLHAGVALDALIGALGMSALGAALVFGALLDERSVAPQDFPMDAAMFFGDLVLLGATVAVLALMRWRPGRTIAMLGGGFALCAVVDSFSLWQGATGFDLQTTSVFALWPAAALAVGFAAWQRPRTAPAAPRLAAVEGWRTVAMPSAFAALALGLLLAHAIRPLNPLAVGLAAATLATVIARMALTLAQHMRLLAASRAEALTDALTGLGNRRRLMLDLDEASSHASDIAPVALLLFDLDGFKQYNDWHGHPAGDTLLRSLGERLASAAAGRGRAYRLGGDEFCLIAEGDEVEARELRARALEALTDSAGGFEVSSSCGLVMLPDDAATPSAVLQIADERLYAQKARRRRFSVGRETSSALVQAMHEREPELGDHVDDVAELARRLGAALGLDGEELERTVRAAELHDVGKVAVPDAILQKPGPLNEAEWGFMREHTIVGDRILSAAPALEEIAKLVRASHERYDGRGYPDRLMGEEIPLGARIVSVCDAFHAMTTDRPYRPAIPVDDALTELDRCAGKQFDPDVVAAFARLIRGSRATSGADLPAPRVDTRVSRT